ncbi:hypothetical protein EDC02_2534 [Micromonospora sp. Llam0]|uniref:hypothetical protein n=1 Tax=Micromonospora sp. Llam0 TaxID=2485143 RepID=UPI000F49E345|nr:hypothetical protein [Micromonospora sp. Llam0]ROO60623.1 hypothetical protein EDC02_2534 [Micromonospora sp. Llam0]
MKAKLTIVTPTSVIPTHPSTDIILEAIQSIVENAGLHGCRHLIICDGHPDPGEESTQAYSEYLRRLRKLSDSKAFGTESEVVELGRPVGVGGTMLAAYERVDTPYALHFEHDWKLIRPIDSGAVLAAFERWNDINYVRLSVRRIEEAGSDSVLKPDAVKREIPLVRTCSWSASPHFSRTEFYRRVVLPEVFERPGDSIRGLEIPIYRKYLADIIRFGFDRASAEWGIFLLGDFGDPPLIDHIDGRATVPEGGTILTGTGSNRGLFTFDFQVRLLARAAALHVFRSGDDAADPTVA